MLMHWVEATANLMCCQRVVLEGVQLSCEMTCQIKMEATVLALLIAGKKGRLPSVYEMTSEPPFLMLGSFSVMFTSFGRVESKKGVERAVSS